MLCELILYSFTYRIVCSFSVTTNICCVTQLGDQLWVIPHINNIIPNINDIYFGLIGYELSMR